MKAGSHREFRKKDHKTLKLNTKIGDIILFDVRLTHMGRKEDYLEKLIRVFDKYIRWFFSENKRYKYKTFFNYIADLYFYLKNRSNRYSIFFTYGKNNHFTKSFSIRNMLRQEMQLGHTNNRLPTHLKDNLIRNDVKFFE